MREREKISLGFVFSSNNKSVNNVADFSGIEKKDW